MVKKEYWGGSGQAAEQAVTNPGKLNANRMQGGDSSGLSSVMGSGRSEHVHVLDAVPKLIWKSVFFINDVSADERWDKIFP